MKEITSAEFETEVLRAETPVLVDMFATWCGPCKMLGRVLEDAQDSLGMPIVKIDADQNKDIVEKYGVMGLPTLLLFKDGEVVKRNSGAIQRGALLKFVKE